MSTGNQAKLKFDIKSTFILLFFTASTEAIANVVVQKQIMQFKKFQNTNYFN